MAAQVKVIKDDKAKGRFSLKSQKASEELTYLMNFNQGITFAMVRTMQDLLDLVFVKMANITLPDMILIWITLSLELNMIIWLLSGLHPSIWALCFWISSSG